MFDREIYGGNKRKGLLEIDHGIERHGKTSRFAVVERTTYVLST